MVKFSGVLALALFAGVFWASVSWADGSQAADAPLTAPPDAWVKLVTPPAPAQLDDDSAPVRRLLADLQTKFGADGDALYSHVAFRIQTPPGLAAGNIAIVWNPDTDVVTIHDVHIIRGSQIIDLLAAGQTFTVLRRETNLERAELSGVLTASLQPEGLQVGDIVDYAYTLKRHDPVMQGHSEFLTGLPTGAATDRVFLREIWPNTRPMQWLATVGLPAVKITKGPAQTELLIDAAGVARPTPPQGAPRRYAFVGFLEVSQFSDWSELSALMSPLYVKASTLSPTSPLKAEAAKIKAASNDPKVQAAMALRLVQDQIRYLFLGMNEGGYVPADADLTWSRRFGDCKGKTALLLALLRELGIDAEPALVNSALGDGMNYRLPMVELFDHVLVRAKIEGKTYWLDGTRIGDRGLDDIRVPPFGWALPVQPKGGGLQRLEMAPSSQPETELLIHLDASGGLDGLAPAHLEVIFRGDLATSMKIGLSSLPRADADRMQRKMWEKGYSWIDIDKVAARYDETTGEERLSMDGGASMGWTLDPDTGVREYVSDSGVLGGAVDYTRQPGPNTDAPYAVPFPAYFRATETVVLPQGGKGFAVKGDDVDKTVAGVEYKRTTRIDGGAFSMEASRRSIAPEFPASEAPAAKIALRELGAVTPKIEAPKTYIQTNAEADIRIARPAVSYRQILDRAMALEWEARDDEAVAEFDRAVALKPGEALPLNARCFARALGGKDLDLALKDCNAALALDGEDADTTDSRGLVYFRMGRLDKALDDYSAALKLDPKEASSLYVRGLIKLRKADKAGGEQDIAAAKTLDPSVAEVYTRHHIP